MKVVLFCLFLAGVVLAADELEVRAYRAELDSFRVFEVGNEDVDFDFKKAKVFEAKKMAGPSFESRFFTKGGTFLNYTEWARMVRLFAEGEGEAVYDVKSKRLVVKTDVARHSFLQDLLAGFLETQMRATFELRKVPGVTLGRRSFQRAKWELEGEGVARVSGIVTDRRQFVLRSADGQVSLSGECSGWGSDSSWDFQGELKSVLKGAEVRWRSGLAGLMGSPAFVELGSLDGKATLVASLTVGMVLLDGTSFDDWMFEESGRNIVKERRLRKVLNGDQDSVALEDGRRYQVFEVPPTFWTFMQVDGSKAKTLRELFRENGVDFGESDKIFRLPGGMMFAVEASEVTIELIHGITMAAGITGPPPVLAGHLSRVESRSKLRAEDLGRGKFQIEREIAAVGLPGQLVVSEFGGGELKLEAELQSSGSDDFVEARFWIQEKGEPRQEVAIEAKVGAPILIRQEKVGERWRAWVAVFSARRVEEMVKEGR